MDGQESPIGRLLGTAAMVLLLLVFIGPILWFVLLAIRPSETYFSMPPVLAFTPNWESIRYTFFNPGNNAPQLFNSLVVAVGAVALNLPFSFPAAYALSRYKIRGR
jgi:multiple sugar transport system permease protein